MLKKNEENINIYIPLNEIVTKNKNKTCYKNLMLCIVFLIKLIKKKLL